MLAAHLLFSGTIFGYTFCVAPPSFQPTLLAHGDKFRILALLFEKFFMRALFDDLAAVKYDDLIGVADSL